MRTPILNRNRPIHEIIQEHYGDTVGDDTQASPLAIEYVRAALAEEHTERVRLEEKLALMECALDAINTHFTIVEHAEPATIVYCNRASAEHHGYTREQLTGQPVKLIAPSNWTEEQYQEAYRKLEAGETLRFEKTVKRKDNSVITVGATLIPLQREGGHLTTVSLGADITQRVEAERKQGELQEQLINEMKERERMAIELRLAQKLESIGRLAAGVAHEINTPIQFVSDSLHFLRSSFDDLNTLLERYCDAGAALSTSRDIDTFLTAVDAARQHADLEFLLQEMPRAFERTFAGAQRVANIVRAMKEFAHPDSTEHAPADINHALQTSLIVAANEYKYLATVKTDFAELPPVVCNIGELNQVFLNLIVNAAHAIHDSGKDPSSGGEIAISTALAGDHVEITFSDNGCGIPQQHLDKIYDPFFTTKEVGRGTGQGLAITRSIIMEKHGGNIRVKSVVGVGTQFTLCLPVNGKTEAI